jgi:1-aminocyclopropane-1-carboxylate deaminase/D-cysteine desulfhydrase-like pyridoxal-dependent ACC family enzyme
MYKNSPFELHSFKNHRIFVKRDDLLDKDFSGNKARKFYYFLVNDFLHVKRVVSYGSNQSNAMYSLSVLAKLKGWEYIYFTDHIPEFLEQNPVGNYKYALQNGMKIYKSKDRAFEANKLSDKDTLVIQEGGRQKEAKFGLKILAEELKDDIKKQNIKNPYVFLPSGTGATSLFLQKYLDCKVFTCSTVGDDEYLKKQWSMLENNEKNYPTILSSPKKYHYGKLYLELYELWSEIKNEMGVEFDLMYDAVGWKKFLLHVEKLKGTPIYIHQGGIKGNESMLARYVRKYGIIR